MDESTSYFTAIYNHSSAIHISILIWFGSLLTILHLFGDGSAPNHFYRRQPRVNILISQVSVHKVEFIGTLYHYLCPPVSTISARRNR